MSPAHKPNLRHGGDASDPLNTGAARQLAAESSNPVLAEVVRSGWVESVHRGAIVLIDQEGGFKLFGDATVPTYPRSSLKPLQATAMVRNGLRLPPRQLALVSASHSGTPEHVEVVSAILASAGLDSSALRCPAALPENTDDCVALIRSGGSADSIHHNCSGKHAGMLATCVANGYPTDGYLSANHPLQKNIRRTIEELTGEGVSGTGVDGCGAPVFVITLPGLARAFRYLASAPADLPEGQVAAAAREFPYLLGGPGRSVSEIAAATAGLLAKDGAEGVWGAALPDGRSLAVKIDDGALRALPVVLASVVQAWGFSLDDVLPWEDDIISGGGEPVGTLRPSPELIEWLRQNC